MSEFGSPSNVLGLLVGGPGMQDGPEAGRRQAEWERQIETLDQKEMELHQTQLKLIRQQTATFIQDLGALRQEMNAMKMKHEADMGGGLDSKLKEVKDAFQMHKKDHDAKHGALQGKLAILEKEFPGHRDELAAFRSQMRGMDPARLERRCADVEEGLGKHSQLHQEMDRKLSAHKTELERKLDSSHSALKDGMARHADGVARLQSSVEQGKNSFDFHHGSLNDRLDGLEKDVMAKLATKLSQFDADIKELRAFVGDEKHTRDGLHGKIQESIKAHTATTVERLNYLEKLLGDSSDKHAQELSRFHGSIAQHASMGDRLKYLEKMLGDSADKHAKELKAAHDRMDQLHGKLQDHHSQLAHHAPLEDRMNYLEKLLGDSADKHTEALRAAHAKLDQMHGRVSATEKQGAAMEDFKKMHHATLKERVDYLEKLLGDSADKHSREVETLKAAQAKHEGAFSKHSRDLEAVKAAHLHHANVGERLSYVEKLLGDSADKHAAELAAAHAKLDQMHGRLSTVEQHGTTIGELKKAHASSATDKKALEAHHASLKERVEYLEKLLNDSADKHDKHNRSMDAAHSKLDQLHSRLAACEKTGTALGDLKKAHNSLANEKAALDAHHATVRERVDYLEKAFGDSADKHAKELQALKTAHAKNSKDVESLRTAHAHHATVAERISYVEKLLGDSADKHAEELAAAHAKLDQVHGRLSQCEKHGTSLGDLKKAHSGLQNEKAELEAHHATLKERVDYLENMLGASADKHAKALEALKAAHSKHAKEFDALKAAHAHHATMAERVNYVEKLLGDSADKHAEELAALKVAHGKHEGAFSKHTRDFESLKTSLAHHATVGERLNYLEKLLGDSADKHGEAVRALHEKFDLMHGRVSAVEKNGTSLSELKKSHSSLAAEKAALEGHHATLKERVDYLESLAGDSADKHARMLEAAHAKLDSMHGRLSSVEKHGGAIDDLKKSHASLANDKAALDVHHSTMQERVDYLEKMLGDSADKHAKEVEALKAAHAKHEGAFAKHAKDLESLKVSNKHHATIGERLDYIEQTIGDSADKHTAELSAAHAKIEKLHGRFSDERAAREAHSGSVKDQLARDAMKRDQHHATLKERVDYLEGVLGDNADKHSKELETHKATTSKLASDHKSHELRHASMAERVEVLEKAMGESMGKHGQELKAAQAKLDRLNGRVSLVRDAWGQDV